MKVATDIKTKDWDRIIDTLIKDGWKVQSKYQGVDAGIDNDFLILSKKTEQISLGWTNYFEGEIKCPDWLLDYLGKKLGIVFEYRNPVALSPGYFIKRKPIKIGRLLNRIFKKVK